MFSGCTSLKTAPELPATTLSVACYQGMFSGCTNLTTAPVLPATTLANFCYKKMFSGCKSLKEVTIKAPSIKGYTEPLTNWLYGVSSAGTVYYTNDNFIKSVSTDSASGIPTGWKKKEATF